MCYTVSTSKALSAARCGAAEKQVVSLKTLFISDLDGTLLTANETVSAYSLEHINRLVDEEGLLFTYATARSLNSAAKACWGLRQNLPVILYNGALIMEPQTKRVLHNNHFNKGQLSFLKEQFALYDVWPLVYSFRGGVERVSWMEGKETSGVMRYLDRRRGDIRLHPVHEREELRGDDIFYFTCIDEKERLDGLHEAVVGSLDMKCIYERETYQSDYWCEIMPADTSKGAAAARLKELLGVDRLVVFGDAHNDRELFLAADESYAVANADEDLKEIATGVIGYSEEDAVAKFLLANLEKYI